MGSTLTQEIRSAGFDPWSGAVQSSRTYEATRFPMHEVVLPGGNRVPALGQGTWRMGERADRRASEIEALRMGVELGMTLIDTAEMYGDGATEILYNVSRRRPEFDLLPAMAERGISVMAYSPVEQGRLPTDGALQRVADRHGATPYQVALAWVMRAPGTFAIPKVSDVAHVRENRAAADLQLTPEDFAAIDAEFPEPQDAAGDALNGRCSKQPVRHGAWRAKA